MLRAQLACIMQPWQRKQEESAKDAANTLWFEDFYR